MSDLTFGTVLRRDGPAPSEVILAMIVGRSEGSRGITQTSLLWLVEGGYLSKRKGAITHVTWTTEAMELMAIDE